ncbi:hypothetical protein [Rathayibacter soli]|uniref:hypothetical protein n=1 Tax=Rathayibacter soli TaxID=3144168 RepID=UPI0027E43B7F|nr:hypothetical protein [Glaciibacter superstes]
MTLSSLRFPSALKPAGTLMRRTPRGIRLTAAAVLLGLLLSSLGAVFAAAPASAIISTGAAVGHSSTSTGLWIGTYRLADGQSGFCLNLGRPSPRGSDFTPVDLRTLGWYSADDAARLAYIARTWGATTDPDVAASAQLATWLITGLNGQTTAALAARANGAATAVLAAATSMLAQVNGATGASRGVAARVLIERGDDGSDTVRAELDVDYLSGGSTLPPGTHRGTLTLEGARFADGSTTAEVGNGEPVAIRPATAHAILKVTAHAEFGELPYGDNATVAHNPSDVQNLLLGGAASARAVADASAERPTPLPFRPQVVTRTSAATAAVGAEITDHLTVSAADGADRPGADSGEAVAPHSTAWGIVGADGGPYTPIPVTVLSTLFGPFESAPERAAEPPAGAPVVCEVSTVIDQGPGDYETEPCTLPTAGHYVWAERIDAADTAAEHGAARILPWRSAFGVAEEVSFVPAPAAPAAPPANARTVAPVRHELAATGRSIGLGAAAQSAITFAAGALLTGLVLLAFSRGAAVRCAFPGRPPRPANPLERLRHLQRPRAAHRRHRAESGVFAKLRRAVQSADECRN